MYRIWQISQQSWHLSLKKNHFVRSSCSSYSYLFFLFVFFGVFELSWHVTETREATTAAADVTRLLCSSNSTYQLRRKIPKEPTAIKGVHTSSTVRTYVLSRPKTSFWCWSVWWTHVDQPRVVSFSEVVQHGGFIQARQVGHVLHFTEARRIHPLHLFPGQGQLPLALGELHLHLIAAFLPDTGRLEHRARSWFKKKQTKQRSHVSDV